MSDHYSVSPLSEPWSPLSEPWVPSSPSEDPRYTRYPNLRAVASNADEEDNANEEENEDEGGNETEEERAQHLVAEWEAVQRLVAGWQAENARREEARRRLPLHHISPNPSVRNTLFTRVPDEDLPEPREDCVICTDPLEPEGQVVRLPCNHEFHAPCIHRWLRERTRRQASCPLCRTSYRIDWRSEEEEWNEIEDPLPPGLSPRDFRSPSESVSEVEDEGDDGWWNEAEDPSPSFTADEYEEMYDLDLP